MARLPAGVSSVKVGEIIGYGIVLIPIVILIMGVMGIGAGRGVLRLLLMMLLMMLLPDIFINPIPNGGIVAVKITA